MKNLIYLLPLLLLACSDHEIGPGIHGEIGAAVAASSIAGNSSGSAGPTTGLSGGPNLLGVTVPTGTAAVGRIQNGLEGLVKPTQGNFQRSLAQVRTNLPKSTDVTAAAGYDQIELLVYSACSDLTSGSVPLMQSKYGIQPSATVTANQAALVAAGMRMLDQHTAGIASQGSASAQLTTIFTGLVLAQTGNTSKMAFMTVCIAANTAGTALLGM
jgi:hypothetical protein